MLARGAWYKPGDAIQREVLNKREYATRAGSVKEAGPVINSLGCENGLGVRTVGVS